MNPFTNSITVNRQNEKREKTREKQNKAKTQHIKIIVAKKNVRRERERERYNYSITHKLKKRERDEGVEKLVLVTRVTEFVNSVPDSIQIP